MIQPSSLEAVAEMTRPVKAYNYAIGYLRAFTVGLVIAHHTALSYLLVAPPPSASLLTPPRLWLIFPVIDTHRWALATLLVAFNDNFFMSLMFFLSGLFFWSGFQRKGAASFLRDRVLRLGLPFVIGVLLFAPAAYYPSYLQTTAHTGLGEFWREWRGLGIWPGGPMWFIWVLLVFDCLAALLFTVRPGWAPGIGRLTQRVAERPLLAGLALVLVTAVVYIPMAAVFTSMAWAAWGPFAFQISRILHYFVYFLLAVGIGAVGIDDGLLAPRGRLAGSWAIASIVAVVCFALLLMTGPFAAAHGSSSLLAVGFVVCCATACLAFLAVFLRFMQRRRPVWDSLAANSYGIYLVHYMFVNWIAYLVLPAAVPGYAKFAFVFVAALLMSWMTSAALRRIPVVRRII